MLASNTADSSTRGVDGNILPSIEDRIQALSQELQDLILDFTLSSGVKCHNVWIVGNYKPPWQLQVNKRTRRFLLNHYSSESLFTVVHNSGFWRSWLRSLPATTLSMIQHIGVHEDRPRWLEGLRQGDDPSKQPGMVRWVAKFRENVFKLTFPFVELVDGDITWMSKAEMQSFMELYERKLALEALSTEHE
ncbi:hypothetical protein CKM354_000459200 [Cercospora kikuchii]|uniref:Uncharacterized protein n=1 Tax=Cercospora kikuchii TaxID=84275 RepID=A0A9P3FBG9_9PEZI|nr:uncharacterized protein CKM354_000459200 [Cercospora kikuchii]GIZ41281.1 hypothetical protein CKM354_000459200 [Cercospora kikuchii]